jgi:hypothetical protein
MCSKVLKNEAIRVKHLRKCAAANNISPKELIAMLRKRKVS